MFKKLSVSQYKTEILPGLTVAIALVSEAVAFAFIAHVHPLVGLYAAFFIGLITSLLGGRPGMISGATGALAVVMVSLVVTYGIANLITGFFGGMGGCAMIGQSMININSGARYRISGISAALFLLSFIARTVPLF